MNPDCPAPQAWLLHTVLGGHLAPPLKADTLHMDVAHSRPYTTVQHRDTLPWAIAALIPALERRGWGPSPRASSRVPPTPLPPPPPPMGHWEITWC